MTEMNGRSGGNSREMRLKIPRRTAVTAMLRQRSNGSNISAGGSSSFGDELIDSLVPPNDASPSNWCEHDIRVSNRSNGPSEGTVKKSEKSVIFWRQKVQIAVRTAVMSLILALPVYIDDTYKAMPDLLDNIGGITLLFLIFTVYENLGITVAQAWQGFIGVFVTCMYVHFVDRLMPGGARGDQYATSIIHIANVLYIFLCLWLNISHNTRTWLLSYHCYFMMEFMNPKSTVNLSFSWSLRSDSMSSNVFFTGMAGVVAAVLVMVVPWPIRAGQKCCTAASLTVDMLTDLVDDLVLHHCDSENYFRVHRFEADVVALWEQISTMQADLDGFWWEGFDIGSHGQTRLLLQRHLSMMQDMSDIAFSLQLCVAKEVHEDQSKSPPESPPMDPHLHAPDPESARHRSKSPCSPRTPKSEVDRKKNQSLIKVKKSVGLNSWKRFTSHATADFDQIYPDFSKISPKAKYLTHMTKVTEATSELLKEATTIAKLGSINEQQRENLNELMETTRNQVRKLNRKWREMANSAENRFRWHKVCEASFVFCLTKYARCAILYTEGMLNRPPVCTSWTLAQTLWTAFVSTFDYKCLLLDYDHRSYTLRNTLSMLIAFYCGYWYMDYSSVPSCTLSLLISKFMGSAMQKNLCRLVGVVIGHTVPHAMKRVLGMSCEFDRVGMTGASLFMWQALTSYVYFHSPSFGYVGCLAAAFGPIYLIYACGDEDAAEQAAFEASEIQKIRETIFAVTITTVVDNALMCERASSKAVNKFLLALVHLQVGLTATFMNRNPDGEVQGGPIVVKYTRMKTAKVLTPECTVSTNRSDLATVHKSLAEARRLGREADLEPRSYRAPWPSYLFDHLLTFGCNLRAIVSQLEEVLKEDSGVYTNHILECIKKADDHDFEQVQQDLLGAMVDVIYLTEVVLLNETGKGRDQRAEVDEIVVRKEREDMWSLINGIKPESFTDEQTSAMETLEGDFLCRISMALVLFDAAAMLASKMEKACIQVT